MWVDFHIALKKKLQTGSLKRIAFSASRRYFWNVINIAVALVTAENKAVLSSNDTLSGKMKMPSKHF